VSQVQDLKQLVAQQIRVDLSRSGALLRVANLLVGQQIAQNL
jgi:hypothetical protein